MTIPETVLLVPGFQEALADRGYDKVMRQIKQLGCAVQFIPIQWRYTTQQDWLRQLNEQYYLHNPATTILAGFSYGACVALMAAAARSPHNLWLCSLSPLFAEFEPEWDGHDWRVARKRRLTIAKETSLADLAQRVNCPTVLFIGEKEMARWPIMEHATQAAATHIKDSRIVVIKGVGHAIDDPGYTGAIIDNHQRRIT